MDSELMELMFDCTDLADWELSVEVELTKAALPSLEDKPEENDE